MSQSVEPDHRVNSTIHFNPCWDIALSLVFSPNHVFKVELTRTSLPLSSRLIKDVRATAGACRSSKQCIGDGVSVCLLCTSLLPSTQILGGSLPGSRCGVHVFGDVSFLEPACWVARCVCVCV